MSRVAATYAVLRMLEEQTDGALDNGEEPTAADAIAWVIGYLDDMLGKEP